MHTIFLCSVLFLNCYPVTFLSIHYFILVLILSRCTASKYLVINSFAKPKFFSFLKSPFQNFIPSVGLQDGDIIIFFVCTDLIRQVSSVGPSKVINSSSTWFICSRSVAKAVINSCCGIFIPPDQVIQ